MAFGTLTPEGGGVLYEITLRDTSVGSISFNFRFEHIPPLRGESLTDDLFQKLVDLIESDTDLEQWDAKKIYPETYQECEPT